jgi:hypothetical protein
MFTCHKKTPLEKTQLYELIAKSWSDGFHTQKGSEPLAGPTGIEPATYGFFRPQRDLRVRCSALLSYGPTYFKKEQLLRNIELAVFGFED